MNQRASQSLPGETRAGRSRTEATERAVLDGFEGPADELARQVLAAQMRLGGASAGAMLAEMGGGEWDLLAAVPPSDAAPAWVEAAREGLAEACRTGRAVAGRLADAERAVVVVPCGAEARLRGTGGLVLAFLIESVDPLEVDAARERLNSAGVLAALVGSRLALSEVAAREAGLRNAAEVVGAFNGHERFRACVMALVNEVASRLGATRVSLGMARTSGVECVAVSHTERFVRAGELVRDLEAAMDEAVDQDADTSWPHPEDATFIARQASEVARRHGPACVSVLVLRGGGERDGVVGALLVEREPGRPLDADEHRWLRLALDLVTPRTVELDERDAWIGRRLLLGVRRGLRSAASPKHSAWKLGVPAGVGLIAALLFIPTDLESRGGFAVEPVTRRVVAAPFDGVLSEVRVRVGDAVRADETVLGTLDGTELSLKLAEARAQRESLLRQAEAARGGPSSGSAAVGAVAEARLFEAQAEEASARVRLLESRLSRAALVSPIDGVVSLGDVERLRGASVRLGDPLFEVSSLSDLVATVAVPEARAADVRAGQPVVLRPTGRPDVELAGTVDGVGPRAEVVDQRNVVKVRVRFEGAVPEWLRPGMEGVAAVRTGRASLARAWTRGAADWVRLKLWW